MILGTDSTFFLGKTIDAVRILFPSFGICLFCKASLKVVSWLCVTLNSGEAGL
jgi:hypothetical protein